MIGGTAVTEYYVASLIGKTLVLLVAPVNTIIISYLTKEKKVLGKPALNFPSRVVCCRCLLGFGKQRRLFSSGFLYGSVEATAPYITVINLTQIFKRAFGFIFILVLTFTEARWR